MTPPPAPHRTVPRTVRPGLTCGLIHAPHSMYAESCPGDAASRDNIPSMITVASILAQAFFLDQAKQIVISMCCGPVRSRQWPGTVQNPA